MGFEDHDWIESIPPETVVWRFMGVDKYLSLLSTRELWFANASKMSDTWEGLRGTANRDARPSVYGEHFEAMTAANVWAVLDEMRDFTYLNCWHRSSVESAAMWSLYASEQNGVALKTTWGKLTSSLTSNKPVNGGPVQYVDYSKHFIPEESTFSAFLFKRQSFEHEREVRLFIQHFPTQTRDDGTSYIDYEAALPIGFQVPVDLDALNPEVFVSPLAAPWLTTAIIDVTRRFDMQWVVTQSDLYNGPR